MTFTDTATSVVGRYRVASDTLLILASNQTNPPEVPVRIMEFTGSRLVLEHSHGERMNHYCTR